MFRPTRQSSDRRTRGFTLMEMMTAVALMLMVIISVGIIFKSASQTVGVSQASMEMLSNVRAAQQQIDWDVGNLNRSGFLVIRSTASGVRRFDQICFLASGPYVNRTGSTAANPFADQTTANAALVWYGQPWVETFDNQPANQANGLPLNYTPLSAPNTLAANADKDYILARHTTLLLSPTNAANPTQITENGYTVAAYPSVIYSDVPSIINGAESTAAHITASRTCTAAVTPSMLMQRIMTDIAASGRSSYPRYEADQLCYRFKVLPNVYASEVATKPLVNASFRMHPILLQGVPTFDIYWTDGTTDGSGNTQWYGLNNPKGITPAEPTLANGNGDSYTAIFSYDNKAQWPKALKFHYRVTDPNNRLQGGRDFVQVVKLPD